MLLLCAGCDGPIIDRFLLNVLDRAWHIKCVQCSECKCSLTDKCFSRDGRLFCRDDFFRRFGTKCGGCGQGILPNDLVRRARQSVYHIKCFLCTVCRKQLATGEQLYVVDENQFLCKDDYIATKLNSGFSDPLGSDGDAPIDKADETFSDHDDFSPCAAPPPCFNNDESSRDSVALPFPAMTSNARKGGYVSGRGPVSSSSGLSPPISDWRAGSKPDNCGGSDVIIKSEQQNGVDDCSFDSASSCCDDTASVRSSGLTSNGINNNNNNNDEKMCGKDKSGTGSDAGAGDGQASGGVGGGAKRRGPRTTIKAKQLETLKSAFAATPKPTRHIREQLAQETGLNMRVIQVWFQNRRSKERRMKQLSAMGARRQFFRNPRRLRALRPGEEFGPDALDLLGPAALGYFTDGCEFYTGYPGGGFGDYFPSVHHGVADHSGLAFLSPPPTSVPHVSQQQQQHHPDHHLVTSQQLHHEGMFMPGDLVLHSAPLQQTLQSSPALQSHQHQQPSSVPSSAVIGRHSSSPVDQRHLVQASAVSTQQQQQQQASLTSAMIDGGSGVHHFSSTVSAATMSQINGAPALSAVAALSGPPQTVMSAPGGGLFGHHQEMMETW